jgi:phage baseplate assembly protein W
MKTLRIPLQLDSRRQLAVATDADAVRMQIIDVVVTALRERPFRPTYGAGVPEMLFGTIDPGIFAIKAGEVRDSIRRHMVGGIINSVVLSEPPMNRGTLNVSIAFSMTPGGEIFEINQTFTGLVTEETFQ